MDGWKDGWHELIYECWVWELMGGGTDGWMEGWMTWANLRVLGLRTNGWWDGWMEQWMTWANLRVLALRTNGWWDGWMDGWHVLFLLSQLPTRLQTWVLGHENKLVCDKWQQTMEQHSSIYIHLSIYLYIDSNAIHTLVTNTTLDGLHVEHGDRLLFLKSFNSQLVL
jgi:hypothetical protein